MPLEGKTASSWWGCLRALCLVSQKPSKWEFFVPAGTDLGVKLLNTFVEKTKVMWDQEQFKSCSVKTGCNT